MKLKDLLYKVKLKEVIRNTDIPISSVHLFNKTLVAQRQKPFQPFIRVLPVLLADLQAWTEAREAVWYTRVSETTHHERI